MSLKVNVNRSVYPSSRFSNIFSETTGLIEAKFIWSLNGMGERKVPGV